MCGPIRSGDERQPPANHQHNLQESARDVCCPLPQYTGIKWPSMCRQNAAIIVPDQSRCRAAQSVPRGNYQHRGHLRGVEPMLV